MEKSDNSSNIAVRFLRFLIWVYRQTLSRYIGQYCRFVPTCSVYADEALRIHGAVKGSILTVKRLCRCHPWGGYGFDPVPGSEKKDKS